VIDWLTYDGLTRQDFGRDDLLWIRDPSMILLHSTEGGSYPGYNGGADEPHFTIDPRGRTCRQHVPLSRAARALVAPAGGHTNTGGPIQVEIIGTCDPRNPYLPSVLDLDDGALGYLAELLQAISVATGIPLTTSVSWAAYPGSYGLATSQRLSWGAWNTYAGVLGHQHVPGNDHGDPGSINVARLLELAGGAVPVSNQVPTTTPSAVPAGPVVIAPGVPAPPFPLPAGSYFGPKSGPTASVSGFYSHREDLRRWQQRMADRGWTITPDGLYGDQTASIAHAFQAEKGLGVDSLIGPITWGAAWTAPVTHN
jgi:peptidoglycan hydrolase-like protein with peptidoglycan-binding domain